MSSKKIILGILITVIAYYAIATNWFGLFSFGNEIKLALLISRIEFWVLIFLLFIYSKKIEKNDFLLIKEQRKKWWFYPIAIITVIVVVTITMKSIEFIESSIGFVSNTIVENKFYEILCSNKSLLIFTCITAAVTEELLFRGYLLSRVKILTKSNAVAVLISALLFGLAHFGYDSFNRMFFPFIIGLIFGSYYVKYKNISVLIICHFLMDFYTLYSQC